MKSITSSPNFPALEKDIIAFWKENNCFLKSIDNNKNNPNFLFYDGPPFATGLPHYGHMLAGTIKDIIPRFKTMQGYHVDRRFGWDTHGLPIEMITEKDLGLRGSPDILKFGVDKFNEECRSRVLKFVSQWEAYCERLGRWVDFKRDYRTMDADFMESVWWVFKQLWNKDRIYQGYKVMPYSWRLSTPLSNFEASSNYKDVQDPALTIKFKIEDEDTYFLAWTTTAWTLPGNLGLCVNPNLEYSYVESENGTYILATPLVAKYFTEPKVIKTVLGRELVGTRYQPIFNYFKNPNEKNYTVYSDDFVSLDAGTGVVHMAAYGEDDFRILSDNGAAIFQTIDDYGNFIPECGELKNINLKEAEVEIIKILKANNSIFKHETINHSYPFCERSDTPLIYRPIKAWYVKVADIRDQMVKNNQTINWVPEHIKAGRFGTWLEQARDWNISRNRYWGNPLPIWICDKCSKQECLGSKAELEAKINEPVTDLHKHFVDKMTWKCECSGTMTRIPEVLDCWFESGSMPYAQLHYPFENKELFENSFPADFIAEGLDQTRGWFYTLMVLSTSLFEKAPFQNCIVNGMILAEDGKKMSKRLQNYPDPQIIFDQYGADAVRLFIVNSPAVRGEPLRFSEAGVKEIVRSVLLPLWNVYYFFNTYALVDGYKPSSNLMSSKNPVDQWIISRFESLVKKITAEIEAYRLYTVLPELLQFLEETTNWYIRRSRKRFWNDNAEDKQQGYDTILYILLEFSKCLAPFLPFITESIYQNLRNLFKDLPESIHYCSFPKVQEKNINLELEEEFKLIQDAVTLGRSLRVKLDLKIRQPLASLTVATKNSFAQQALEKYSDHIKEELNIREVKLITNDDNLVELTIKPNFPILGKRYGKDLNQVKGILANWNTPEINQLEQIGFIEVLGQKVTIDDITVTRKSKNPELSIETSNGISVFFDTNLTPELISEGKARELVNRIQKMRKDADLQISDRINIEIKCELPLWDLISQNTNYVSGETLAGSLKFTENLSFSVIQEHAIDGDVVHLGIEKIN